MMEFGIIEKCLWINWMANNLKEIWIICQWFYMFRYGKFKNLANLSQFWQKWYALYLNICHKTGGRKLVIIANNY